MSVLLQGCNSRWAGAAVRSKSRPVYNEHCPQEQHCPRHRSVVLLQAEPVSLSAANSFCNSPCTVRDPGPVLRSPRRCSGEERTARIRDLRSARYPTRSICGIRTGFKQTYRSRNLAGTMVSWWCQPTDSWRLETWEPQAKHSQAYGLVAQPEG